MAAIVIRKGKKKIITNNGNVQLDMNSNRLLVYDTEKYRFIAGDKPDGQTKIQLSNDNVNVLDLP